MKNILSFFKEENKRLLSTYNTGLLQGKAYRVLNFHLTDTLKPFDLSLTEWKILGQLYDNNKLKPNEIAKLLEVEPPLITKLINKMENKKLVIRTVDLEDKRVKSVTISNQGKKLIPVIEKKVRACLKIVLKGADINDLIAYIRVLKIIASN